MKADSQRDTSIDISICICERNFYLINTLCSVFAQVFFFVFLNSRQNAPSDDIPHKSISKTSIILISLNLYIFIMCMYIWRLMVICLTCWISLHLFLHSVEMIEVLHLLIVAVELQQSLYLNYLWYHLVALLLLSAMIVIERLIDYYCYLNVTINYIYYTYIMLLCIEQMMSKGLVLI